MSFRTHTPVGGKVFSPLRTGSVSTHAAAFKFFLNVADGATLTNPLHRCQSYPIFHHVEISLSCASLHVPCTRLSSFGSFHK